MNVLITGCAGFIGFHLSIFLKKKGMKVYGIDNISSISKKTQKKRIQILKKNKIYFTKKDLSNINSLKAFEKKKLDIIIHLAAQPGVRISQEKPNDTIKNNITSYINVLEFAKKNLIKNIFFASSSSVYGNSHKFQENLNVFKTTSIYASTKLYNEIISYTYHYLYKINFVGMRFFSIYGSFGREDMAYYKFLNQIFKNKAIEIFGSSNSQRSYTYIDDVIYSIEKLVAKKTKKKKYFNILNIGNSNSVRLSKLIQIISKNIKKKIQVKIKPRNNSDVIITKANNKNLFSEIKYRPQTSIEKGYKKFIIWFKKQ